MLTVVALGGNALVRDEEAADPASQRRNAARAAAVVAHISAHSRVVVTHGNGPQVGWLADQDPRFSSLDVVGAESEGLIGYLLAQSLRNALPRQDVVTVLTQTLVAADDPAFAQPSKAIGRHYDPAEAQRLAHERDWTFRREDEGMRRIVASPEPIQVLEQRAVAQLLEAGALVIAAGGGGIPVVRADDGRLHGREAVVDKDKTSAVLADALGADRLLLLTDVDAVYVDWHTPRQRPLHELSPTQLARYDFAEGSMAPKVAAACRFAAPGRVAAIGALDEGAQVFAGNRGTQIRTDADSDPG